MSKRTDAEFEVLIHSDETHIELLDSDDAQHLREDLEGPNATEAGVLPETPQI